MFAILDDLASIAGNMKAARATRDTQPGLNEPSGPIGAGLAPAGVFVTEDTATTIATVWRAVHAIAGSIMAVPWQVHQKVGDGPEQLHRQHPVSRLLQRRPNPLQTPAVWREFVMHSLLLWGNAYAEIERNRLGVPIALWPIRPDRVTPRVNRHQALEYPVRMLDGPDIVLASSDMLHFKGLGDGLTGYSVVAHARQSLSLTAATEAFGAAFFGNSAMPSGVLTHPSSLSPEARTNLKESWQENHGGPRRFGKVSLLEEGLEYKSISIPPDQAQFLQTRKFQDRDVAKWFGLPPHKMGDFERMTFNNIGQARMLYVEDAVLPWMLKLEQEATAKLLTEAERDADMFTRGNLNGLMRGDPKARGEAYKMLFAMGAISPNGIMAREDMATIGDEGDIRMVPANMTTLAAAHAAAQGPQGGTAQ